MRYLVPLVFVVAIVVAAFLVFRSKSTPQIEQSQRNGSSARREDIPDIISKLKGSGTNGSFVVFMFSLPGEGDDLAPNIQYSIENGKLGFDWVLIAPKNIRDESKIAAFLKENGHMVVKLSMNGVEYLRVEDGNLEETGVSVLRDFYKLDPSERLELVIEGFEWEK